MTILSHKDLLVWQKSMNLVEAIYRLTENFPRSELYGLTSQMKRSAISMPSNIAEGKRRGTRKEYRQFLLIAFGSGAELETQLEIAQRLSFCGLTEYNNVRQLLDEIMRMLNVLINSLQPTT